MKIVPISATLVDHMGSDLSVVNAARVSFDKESEWYFTDGGGGSNDGAYLSPADTKLINYLAKHKHYSPFNHTFLTFRIKAPIFVARQLVKHEYMPWNEVSRRYVDSEPEFWMPDKFHARAENVKQGSGDVHESTDLWLTAMEVSTEAAFLLYKDMIDDGVAPEEARMVLPHNLMTEWIWSGTLKAYHKMLSLRLDSHTQRHTREVAELILPQIEKVFPVSIKALMEHA